MKAIFNGFRPISKNEYVKLFLKSNPSECRDDVVERLDDAIAAHCDGQRCSCGQPLWIIGSAEAGYGCFTCITGEATPSDDYEIELSASSFALKSTESRDALARTT